MERHRNMVQNPREVREAEVCEVQEGNGNADPR